MATIELVLGLEQWVVAAYADVGSGLRLELVVLAAEGCFGTFLAEYSILFRCQDSSPLLWSSLVRVMLVVFRCLFRRSPTVNQLIVEPQAASSTSQAHAP